MSTFCTSCGTASTGAAFCTSCGSAMGPEVKETAVAQTAVSEVSMASTKVSEGESTFESESPSSPESKKKFLLIGAAAVLLLGTGIGSFLAGKSSVDLEKERKASYDAGYEVGDSAGYDRGDSAGYDRGDSAGYDRGYDAGKTAGCLEVFSFSDGTFDYLIPYSPDSYYDKYPGSYYHGKSEC